MKSFVRKKRRRLEVVGMLAFAIAGAILGAVRASAGVTWLVALTLLAVILVIEIGPENTRFSRKGRRKKRPRTRP